MSMKSITISTIWLSLMRQENRRKRLIDEHNICFDALYQKHYSAIFAFLHFLVGTPEAAEDLTSLVFEKVWMHLEDIQAHDMVGPWIFRIARNCATDYFRRCKPTVSLECLLSAQHPLIGFVEEIAIAHEEERILLAHLSQLSEREREVIGLKFAVGMTNREIARILQVPEGTISSLLHRTLRRLRAALNEDGGLHERQ